jgi:hypothetical protein
MSQDAQLYLLKGQYHEISNFFEGLKNQINTFCICADGLLFFCFLVVKKILFKFLRASRKTLANSGDFTGRCIRISNSCGTSLSSPAYGTIYRIKGSFLNAATSILKRVSVRIFKTGKCFHRSQQKLEFTFSQ